MMVYIVADCSAKAETIPRVKRRWPATVLVILYNMKYQRWHRDPGSGTRN
jgi:hypothetical protein